MPLLFVENQGYIHYQKGSLAFYALRDYIGEDAMNQARRAFIQKWALKGPPYTRRRRESTGFARRSPRKADDD